MARTTLALAVGEAAPGERVGGSGTGFSTSHGGAASAEPVVVHFGSGTGPVLWAGRPGADQAISFTFTVPAVPPGEYTVVATQTNADGVPAPGTPAQAVLTVVAPPQTTTTAPPPPPTAPAATEPATSPTPTTPTSTSSPSTTKPATSAFPASAPPTGAPPAVTRISTPATGRAPSTPPDSADGGSAGSPPPSAPEARTAPAVVTAAGDARTGPARPLTLAARATEAEPDAGGRTPAVLFLVLLASVAVPAIGIRRYRAHRSR